MGFNPLREARRRPSDYVMLAAAFAIRPLGDFPLNDDWAFALPVKWLVERGQLQFTDWQAMTLIGQVTLGADWRTVRVKKDPGCTVCGAS